MDDFLEDTDYGGQLRKMCELSGTYSTVTDERRDVTDIAQCATHIRGVREDLQLGLTQLLL